MKVKMSKKQWEVIRGYLGCLSFDDIERTMGKFSNLDDVKRDATKVDKATQQLFIRLRDAFPKNKYL